MAGVVLGGAEHDLGLAALGARTQSVDELDPAHHRHVPVEQDHVGHARPAVIERSPAVFGLFGAHAQGLDDVARDLSDHARIIDYQAGFHFIVLQRHEGFFAFYQSTVHAAFSSRGPAMTISRSMISRLPVSVSTKPWAARVQPSASLTSARHGTGSPVSTFSTLSTISA